MKRFVSLFLVFLLLFCSVSCGEEKYNLLYSEDVGDLTFSVRGSGKRLRQVVVKRSDGILLFAEEVKVDPSVGEQGGTYGLDVTDLNFDGVSDFLLTVSVVGECKEQLVWIWDPGVSEYRKSEALSGKCNVEADGKLETVFTFSHFYTTEKAYADVPASHTTVDAVTQWEPSDGDFLPSQTVSLTYYSETDRYCYSVSYFDVSLGKFEDPDDYWFTPEEYEKEDFSFLYYFR